ncbi:MAG: hypothetical protein HY868_21050 [Chloroflexi bacterium]|nr:hypothetical protein [Chloroflexota bacterium]
MTRTFLALSGLVLIATACVPTPTPTAQPTPTATASSNLRAQSNTPTATRIAARAQVTITLGAAMDAPINRLLGVNIGPVPAGSDPKNADLANAYKQIGVNLVRTHDFYGPLDMAVMYPDRARDPADQKSYDFTKSDAIWRAIVNGGFEPYLRLGDSYNNAKPPANAQERANWVKAAVAVIRHYREGKWNGFTTQFRYVEIWNEPDNQQFWSKPRTAQEYFQLYDETARALKQTFPDLIVGAPGLTPAGALAPQGKKWTQDFLDYVRQKNAPLDFFSWHMYSNDPNDWANAAQFYRRELDARGFTKTAQHVTEWNTQTKSDAMKGAEATALRTSGQGAAILTAAWIAMQQNGVAVATFYRGPDPALDAPTFYGMFYADGKPKRIALAFSLWTKLADHPQRVNVSAAPNTSLWMLAGKNDAGESALLIANPTAAATTYSIAGAENRATTIWQVNDASAQVQSLASPGAVIEIGGNTMQLVILKK